MSKRLILIPRWAGTSQSDWYPWLRAELQTDEQRTFDPIILADMPHPELPVIDAWVSRIKTLIGPELPAASNTIVAAHSVGCQAVLRALAELPSSGVAGLFLVAPWFTIDAPWDAIRPWIDVPFDLKAARARAGKVIAVMSDNDRHRKDWRANRQSWEERLGAEVVLVPGASHFNDEQYPALLQMLLAHFGSSAEAQPIGKRAASWTV